LESCAISKYVAPPFTDVDKILELKHGQSAKAVAEVLKIKPYDIVYAHDKGKVLLIYNYRVKDRRMVLPTKTAGQVIHSEEAQRQGDLWYNKNYRELYLLFEDDKLGGIFGEEVLAAGAQIETMDAILDGRGTATDSPKTATHEDIAFARSVYQEREQRKSAELSEDQAAKNRRNILIGGGSIIGLLLFNIISN